MQAVVNSNVYRLLYYYALDGHPHAHNNLNTCDVQKCTNSIHNVFEYVCMCLYVIIMSISDTPCSGDIASQRKTREVGS